LKKKNILTLCIGLLLILFVFRTKGNILQSRVEADVPIHAKRISLVKNYVEGFKLSQMEMIKNNSGETTVPRYELNADTFLLRPKQLGFFQIALIQEPIMRKVNLSLFREGRPIARLEAKQGLPEIDLSNDVAKVVPGVIKFNGNVKVKNLKGSELACEELTWNPNLKQLSSKHECLLMDNGQKIRYDRFYSDEGLENMNYYEEGSRL